MSNRKQNWSNYWKQGLIDSCSGTIKSSDSEILKYWMNVAATIQQNDTVVDLCTGAGAVIRELLQVQATEKTSGVKYIGVELSSYSGQKENFLKAFPSQNIELLNDTATNNIPLENHSVNKLVSQFGIEYALDSSFYREVARLLKPKGTFHAVLHHSDSILFRVAEEEVKHYKFIDKKVNLFQILKAVVPYFALLKNPANKAKLNNDPKAVKARDELNVALSEIKLIASKSNHPDLLHDILNSATSSLNIARTENKKVALQFLEQLHQQFKDSYYRSLELCDAALSKSEVETMVDEFSAVFENSHDINELTSNNEVVGWSLSLKRLN